MSYHIIEVWSGNKTKKVAEEEVLKDAKKTAQEHSSRSGLIVEIQDDLGRVISNIMARKD
jgi:hypothetical protein